MNLGEKRHPTAREMDEALASGRTVTRDYTIHLRVRAPIQTNLDLLDNDVSMIVDASSAREAIATGLEYSSANEEIEDEDAPGIELVNFYVVSNTKPRGGIE
jgi:hypothetical protein